MRIYTTALIPLAFLISFGASAWAQQSPLNTTPQNKVYVCHVPPGNPANARVLSISPNALQAHLKHGDHILQNKDDACPTTPHEHTEPTEPTEPKPSPTKATYSTDHELRSVEKRKAKKTKTKKRKPKTDALKKNKAKKQKSKKNKSKKRKSK